MKLNFIIVYDCCLCIFFLKKRIDIKICSVDVVYLISIMVWFFFNYVIENLLDYYILNWNLWNFIVLFLRVFDFIYGVDVDCK